jgi:excisionase family DNA binding protein
VNLKSAARELGVHYQTAYRYVRSGDLVAVRVGPGYEISEAAVTVLKARLAARDVAAHQGPHGEAHTMLTVEQELATLTESCMLTAQPVFDLVTRWLATNVGDMAALHLFSEDGVWLQAMSSFDLDPARRAVVEAFHMSTMIRVADAFGPTHALEGRTVAVHHVSVTDAIRFLPARFKEHADRLMVQSFVSAPVKSAQGTVRGVLSAARFVGGRPYTEQEVGWIEGLAAGIAKAVERVERFSAAWVARDSLFESLEQLFKLEPSLQIEAVSDVVLDLLDDELAEAVFGPDRRLVAANEAFLSRFGLSEATAGEVVVGDGSMTACPPEDVDAIWTRLLSGASDFINTDSGECVDWPDGLRIHWAVVRRPDATAAAVGAACEAGQPAAHMAERSDPSAPLPCWGLCLTPNTTVKIAT